MSYPLKWRHCFNATSHRHLSSKKLQLLYFELLQYQQQQKTSFPLCVCVCLNIYKKHNHQKGKVQEMPLYSQCWYFHITVCGVCCKTHWQTFSSTLKALLTGHQAYRQNKELFIAQNTLEMSTTTKTASNAFWHEKHMQRVILKKEVVWGKMVGIL